MNISSRCPALYLLLLPSLQHKDSIFSPPGMHVAYSEILVLLEKGTHRFLFPNISQIKCVTPGYRLIDERHMM